MNVAFQYQQGIEHFRYLLEQQHCTMGDVAEIETGRKFDKVYIRTAHQRLGRYMVDRNSHIIYGIKSWAQYNPRRIFGTLDTVDQYDWSGYHGVPKKGTPAEEVYFEREAAIARNHKKRGRPRKVTP